MLIDELKIDIKAGNGGNGVVRWRNEKGKEFSGPSGGNGGNGGDVFAEAVRDISILSKYKHLKKIVAENGQDGMNNGKYGKNGDDLIIKFPAGTIITNLKTGKKFSLEEEGQRIMVLRGGRGGLGNEHFKSSVNVRPKEFTRGKAGESSEFFIEMEIIADLGFIGLPNAGKTSLLNSLTGGKHKIGDYSFTTLSPNLGSLFGFVLADIPGIIEDSSTGKGLGIKFLRHIKRTKILLHCISAENKNLTKAYKTIRKELKDYNQELTEKPEYLIITKKDLISESDLIIATNELREGNRQIFFSSVLDKDSIDSLKTNILDILKNINL